MGRGYLKGGKQLEFGEEWGKRKKVERRQFKKIQLKVIFEGAKKLGEKH